MDLTSALGIYGAGLSTAVAGWEVFKHLSDKPCLRVRACRMALMGFGIRRFGVEVVNAGARPVTIVAAGFRRSRQSEQVALIADPHLPVELTEGQTYTSQAIPEGFRDNAELRYAWVRDATGRVYVSRRWPLGRRPLAGVARRSRLVA